MLAGQADVFQDTSHAIPRADAAEQAGDVPAAIRARVLSVVHRRARLDAGEDGAVDGSGTHAHAAGTRTRYDSDSRGTRLACDRLPRTENLHLALSARRCARARQPNWPR